MSATIDSRAIKHAYAEPRATKRNIIEKIWQSHVVTQKEGHPAVFAIDLMLLHEVTSAQAFETLAEKNLPILDPSRLLATIDHSIPTTADRNSYKDEAARAQVETLRSNCRKYGIPLLDFGGGQGIVHVAGPELGLSQPGTTIVCGDSHTSTHGAFGALAFGIGTSEVAHVLATGCLLQERPKTMKVSFSGNLRAGVSAKDAILKLIAELGVGGANGHIIEYTGPSIKSMSMEERMTVCNMSIECGARAGIIAPDETTFAYLKDKPFAPHGDNWQEAAARWQSMASDPGCHYDREVLIDLSRLEPMVTWGTNPAQAVELSGCVPGLNSLKAEERQTAARAMAYTRLQEKQPIAGTAIDWAFVGSCTNGRIEDLRIVGKILSGRKIAKNVTLYIVPGSEAVMKQAQQEGLVDIFVAAGAQFRMPGCSMCLAMNDDKVPAGMRCISSSNRNFIGRQGPGSITHLASPATVAASAIEGRIASAQKYLDR